MKNKLWGTKSLNHIIIQAAKQIRHLVRPQKHQCLLFFSKADREVIPLLAEQYQYTLLLNLDKHLS